jgi:pyocin large subunit-like protein
MDRKASRRTRTSSASWTVNAPSRFRSKPSVATTQTAPASRPALSVQASHCAALLGSRSPAMAASCGRAPTRRKSARPLGLSPGTRPARTPR